MVKPKFYEEELSDGKLLSIRPYQGNTLLNSQTIWDELKGTDNIQMVLRSDKPSKDGLPTPMGDIKTIQPIFIEYIDVTVDQFIDYNTKIKSGEITISEIIALHTPYENMERKKIDIKERFEKIAEGMVGDEDADQMRRDAEILRDMVLAEINEMLSSSKINEMEHEELQTFIDGIVYIP